MAEQQIGTLELDERQREALERVSEWDEDNIAPVARALLHIAQPPKASNTSSSPEMAFDSAIN